MLERAASYPIHVDVCIVSDEPGNVDALLGFWDYPQAKACGGGPEVNATEPFALVWEHRAVIQNATETGQKASLPPALGRFRCTVPDARSHLSFWFMQQSLDRCMSVQTSCSIVLPQAARAPPCSIHGCRCTHDVHVPGGRHGHQLASAAVVGGRHRGAQSFTVVPIIRCSPACLDEHG